MSAPRVNLFLVGAMKGGTHSLFRLLGQHPDVCVATFKEPCHFIPTDVVAANWPAVLRFQDPDAYGRLFVGAAGRRYVCEASTSYTKKPRTEAVAPRIHAYNPEARIVYVVREPMARTISHYYHNYRVRGITTPILEELRRNPALLDVSDYAMQIADFIALFGRDRVKIVISERFRADPVAAFADLLDWLDLPPVQGLVVGSEGDNHVTPSVIGRPTRLLRLSGLRNGRLWRFLRDNSPAFVREAALRLLFADRIGTKSHDKTAVRALIGARIADNRRRFEAMIGEPIPEWDRIQ